MSGTEMNPIEVESERVMSAEVAFVVVRKIGKRTLYVRLLPDDFEYELEPASASRFPEREQAEVVIEAMKGRGASGLDIEAV